MQDRFERLLAVVGLDDGLVNAIGGIVGKLDQEQELGEGVIFEDNALGEPAFHIAVVVAEVFLQREFRQEEGYFLGTTALEIVQGMLAGFPSNGVELHLGGNIGRGERQF